MPVISFFNTYAGFSPDIEASHRVAIESVIKAYDLKNEYVNIIFMTDDELLEMNMTYLNHDYYTDIITFNYAEESKLLEAELYISIDRVTENANTNGVHLEEELLRVIIHGMLHLAGFDDSSDEQRAEMRSLENKFMNRLSFHVKPTSN